MILLLACWVLNIYNHIIHYYIHYIALNNLLCIGDKMSSDETLPHALCISQCTHRHWRMGSDHTDEMQAV